ncbi:MAG TPA: 2-C-methyl-D-erythritol 2,4-cyclodiphosphate synthase [Planctomycetota bacterium]
MRVGIGTDMHRMVFGRKLILGGIEVPGGKGAMGHSDADTLTHAVIDALLGAAGLGDIGHHFPDTDPKWKDADSIVLLGNVVGILSGAGYSPVNIDASIHLEAPKLGRLKQEMSTKIADTLKIPRHCVNIKAKTAEGMDAVGKGEAVECFAVALLETKH